MDKPKISLLIEKFLNPYLYMDLGEIMLNCPYWMNKIRNGKVTFRGKFNGKGTSKDIRLSLISAIDDLPVYENLNHEFVRKLAKRKRIGIDCSGLAYRLLDPIVNEVIHRDLSSIYGSNIDRTNAFKMTGKDFTYPIQTVSDARLGDLIKIDGGKHLLLIIHTDPEYIKYVHSADRSTAVTGVHTGKINILYPDQDLDKQMWLELAKNGQNYGEKYFNVEKGDGIRRLKALENI